MPIPRLAKKNVSGIEMIRTRTSTVATEPIAIATRLSGTAEGVSIPNSLRTTSSTARSPRTKTSLPIVPVCHPRTDTVVPSPSPVYQPVNADTARRSPKRKVSRPLQPGTPPAPNGSRPRLKRPSPGSMEPNTIASGGVRQPVPIPVVRLTLLAWRERGRRRLGRRRLRSIRRRSIGHIDSTGRDARLASNGTANAGGRVCGSGSYSYSYSRWRRSSPLGRWARSSASSGCRSRSA